MKQVKEVRIRFLVDAAPDDSSGNKYVAGQEIMVSPASANFWIVREKAEIVVEEVQSQHVSKGPGRQAKIIESSVYDQESNGSK